MMTTASMAFLFNLVSIALFIVGPVASMEVMLEFSGRPSTLGVYETDLLAEAFIQAYNPDNSNDKKKKKKNKSGSALTVAIDTTGLASLTHEDTVTQPFSILAQVTCDDCETGALFKTKKGKKGAGVNEDSFIFAFNDILITLNKKLLSIDSLIAVQEVEDLGCPVVEEMSTAESKIEMSLLTTAGEPPSEEELDELSLALLESYNFLNTVSATSHRCDKSFHKVTNVVKEEASNKNLRRTAQSKNAAMIGGSKRRAKESEDDLFIFSPMMHYLYVSGSCYGCASGLALFDQVHSKRHLEGNTNTHQRQFARVLADPQKLECMCSANAETDGQMSKDEYVLAVREAIKVLQAKGKLKSVLGLVDINEVDSD